MEEKTVNSSRLIKYLKLIRKEELSRVMAFLNSPFFNTRKDVADLMRLMWKYAPDFKRSLYRKDIYHKLFDPTKNVTFTAKEDNKIRNLMSRLISLLEAYLVQTKQQDHPIWKKRLLVDSLIERKSHELAIQKLDASKQQLKAEPHINIQTFYSDFLLEEAGFYLNVLTRQRAPTTIARPAVNSLQIYSITNLLFYYCIDVNQMRNTSHVSSELNFLTPLTEYLRENLEKVPVVTQIYYNILNMLLDRNGQEYFKQALNLVNEHLELFTLSDRRHIYGFLNNFCAGKIRGGESDFRKYRYTIYDTSIRQLVWTTNSFIPPHHYVIHSHNMLLLGKFEETQEFISEYADKLPLAQKVSIPQLCLTMLHFHKEEYEEAHSQLILIPKLQDYLFVLFEKILSIQIFIEKKEFFLAESNLQSLQGFLRSGRGRNLSKTIQKGYLNFASYTTRLLPYLQFGKLAKLDQSLSIKLSLEIKTSPTLYEREWLTKSVDKINIRK